ncbi:unnamed protein product [Rhizophagus irregularis]|uniref:DUF202 domain-containing protein n=1 Tax=Rhizophagus irregularis TaxID=588596 RepID=A0A2I1GJ34_9GLOM|nr:hypothetical protein RhiirA4_543447 [Rhizophagus irregularis]CAB4424880.1 unnamed protein product [Rhizophagus irregularis]
MSNDDTALLNDLIKVTNRYGTFSRSSSSVSELNLESQALLERSHDHSNKPHSFFPTTIVVKNVGSTARDNLSLERNFLSWLRLSTTLVLVGIAYYFHFEIIPLPTSNHSNILGLFLMFLGNFTLLWALLNYLQFQHMLDRYLIVENGILQFMVAGTVGVAIIAAFIIDS